MADTERRVEFVVPSPRQFFTPAVTAILIIMVIGFAIVNYAQDFTVKYFALTAGGVFSGKIWQLVTYSFIDSIGLVLLFDGMLLLFIGSALEKELGKAVFVLLWVIVSVVCGLIWVIVSRLMGANYLGLGATSCAYGLVAVFGVIFRRRKFMAFFWTVEARYISIGLIVIGIILNIPQPMNWIWISGALVGYLCVKLRMCAARAPGVTPEIPKRRQSFVDID